MHSTIENCAKKASVFTQSQWREIMIRGKVEEPRYKVHELLQEEIFDFTRLATDQNWKKIKIMNLRELKLKANSDTAYFKYEYNENARECPINSNKCLGQTYPLIPARKEKIQLDANKKKDLKYMCDSGVIPAEHHEFYEELIK